MTAVRGAGAWLLSVVSVCALAAVASCSSDATLGAPTSATDVAATSTVRVAPAVDLAPLQARTARAFRADGSTFAAAAATFEATIAGAAIAIAPRRADLTREATSLVLETSHVSRGPVPLFDPRSAPRSTLADDGTVTLERGALTEIVTNDEGGVEQSWRFDRAPSGRGDLVVRVAARGQRYVSSTDHGLHFSAGGTGMRYGTATWVDARGRRTVVVPRFSDGEIVMVVPDSVVASSAYPAVLDPTVTAEREVDQPVSGSSASGDQYNPTIVAMGSGQGYLAVWYDRRGVRPALYGARIAMNGTVIDDTGIAIAVGVASTTPFVAASPNGFLVTWAVSYVDVYQGPGVYAVRLDAEAHPLDSAPLTLVANQTNLQSPTAGGDASGWLVAWEGYSGAATGYDITGLHVPATGPLLDTTPLVISNAVDQEFAPVVSFDGTGHLVAWRSYTQLFGRRYGPQGNALGDRLVLATSTGASLYNFGIAFNGTEHLLVWSDYAGTDGYDIFARRIATSGVPLDLGNLAVTATIDSDDRPRAAWEGTDFLITFLRAGKLAAQRMASTGAMIDPVATVVSATTAYYDYALASDGGSCIAVTRSTGTGLAASDVSGLVIGKPPTPFALPFTVSKAANSETEPVSAWNGTRNQTVWLDTRDGRPSIYGASIGPDGQASAATKIVSDPKYASELTRPRIASDGAGYLVVFYAYDSTTLKRGVHGIRLDANGAPDATGVFDLYVPTLANEYAQEPDVAFDGANYLVVWQDLANDGTSQSTIYASRLPQIGTTTLDKEPIRVTVATPVDARTVPAVAFDGQNYFVSWITSRQAAADGIDVSHVYGTRISRQGAVLEGEQAVCDAFLLQRAPFVAGDTKNGGFMVVWEDYRTALDTADVYGARISSAGQNLDGTSGMKIAAGSYDESRPRVSSSGDGTNWVVAWRDLRSKTNYDLYGAWISLAGKNHDPAGLVLSAEAGDEDAPWLDTSGVGQLEFSYQRLDPRTNYGSYRVRARAITSGKPVTSACTMDDDCASRSCANGVCCATECGGCGTCSATPGTCTPLAASSESPTCPSYRCQGTLECPSTCAADSDCASNATCDPSTKKCVSRVICIDNATLKDLTGHTTACAPYTCSADACRTQCGSVDDCAAGFVCDLGGRCVQPPTASDGGCTTSGGAPGGGLSLAGAAAALAALFARRRRIVPQSPGASRML